MTTDNRSPRPTVLAVDDDPGFLEALGLILSDDFTLLTALSGPQALDLVRKHHVDVVLLDLGMPGLDGFEVLKRLREWDCTLPVIIVTVIRQVGQAVLAMQLGAYHYVTKSWGNDDDLIVPIRAAAQHRSRQTAVLLLSEDPADLAPVEVALHGQMKVVASAPAHASALDLRAEAIVIDGRLAAQAEIAAARAVRARFADAPLVMMTNGATGDPSIENIAALRPAAIFVKPYPLDHALARLAGLLAGRGWRLRGWPRFSSQVRRAVEILARHYSNPPSMSALARAVSTSEDRLRSAFREGLGMSPKEFTMRLQVAVAARLLRETDFKMEEIARRAGFPDESYFSRTFKQARGFRPGEFRRRATGF